MGRNNPGQHRGSFLELRTKLNMELEKHSIVSFFASHLVSIYYVVDGVDADGDPAEGLTPFIASGFILELFDKWFYITAGHVVDDLNRAVERNALLVCRLIDSMGWEARHKQSVVFRYTDESGFKFYTKDPDNGEDYGIISLDRLTIECLRANKVVPLTEDKWKAATADFERYILLGTPMSGVRLVTPPGEKYPLPAEVTPTVAFIQRIDDPPEQLVKPFNRFYGIVPGDTHIGGMSGGPLLGMWKVDGGYRYWFIGVQSGWLASNRVLAACPIDRFAEWVKEAVSWALQGTGYGDACAGKAGEV